VKCARKKWAHGLIKKMESADLRIARRLRKLMGIEKRLEVSLVGALAPKDKQIRQSYQPMLGAPK
jgi:hypothetical protein